MKTVSLCSNCHGDKVQTKMWVEINTNAVLDSCSDGEDDDNYCPDCQQHTDTYLAELNDDAKVIGFQVVSNDNKGEIHPNMDASFCVYSLSQCQEMMDDDDSWRLLAIYTNDIEEPTMMFKGKPRR
jgi:hypothetical protein